MKITSIEAIKVCSVSDDYEKDALAIRRFAEHPMDIILVRVETSDGVVGWGEAFSLGCADAVATVISKVLRKYIVGEDVFSINTIWEKVYYATFRYGRRGLVIASLSGVDIALWDIVGKYLKVPVYKLLGGSKNRIRAYVTGGYYGKGKTIDKLVNEMLSYVKRGFKALKMKIGALTIPEDLERVRAVREAIGGGVRLAVDANNVYTFDEALTMGKELERYDIWFFEEPIPTDYLDQSSLLTQKLNVLIAGYETAYTRYEFNEIMKKHAVDIVQVDAVWAGGISEVINIGNLAKTYGYPLIPHFSTTDIGIAANLHVASALNVEWVEYHLKPNPLRDRLLKTPLGIDGDYLLVPQAPGLGVDVNEDVVEELSRACK